MITLADTATIEAKERSTLRLRARLLDDTQTPIPLASILTWTATLYCKDDPERAILNGKDALALVTNGVVNAALADFFRLESDADDLLTAYFVFPPEDQKILDQKLGYETHVCQFLIVTDADTLRPKFTIHVENLGLVA